MHRKPNLCLATMRIPMRASQTRKSKLQERKQKNTGTVTLRYVTLVKSRVTLSRFPTTAPQHQAWNERRTVIRCSPPPREIELSHPQVYIDPSSQKGAKEKGKLRAIGLHGTVTQCQARRGSSLSDREVRTLIRGAAPWGLDPLYERRQRE